MKAPPLPADITPLPELAYSALLSESQLRKALEAAGIPIYEIRAGRSRQVYVSRSAFDRWFAANLKLAVAE